MPKKSDVGDPDPLRRPSNKPSFGGYPEVKVGDSNRYVLFFKKHMAAAGYAVDPNDYHFSAQDNVQFVRFCQDRGITPGQAKADPATQELLFVTAYPDLA